MHYVGRLAPRSKRRNISRNGLDLYWRKRVSNTFHDDTARTVIRVLEYPYLLVHIIGMLTNYARERSAIRPVGTVAYRAGRGALRGQTISEDVFALRMRNMLSSTIDWRPRFPLFG